MSTTQKTLAEAILMKLEQSAIPQARLAKMIGLARGHLHDVLVTGKRRMTPRHLYLIHGALPLDDIDLGRLTLPK